MAKVEEQIPKWDGNPATFEDYVCEAKWYQASLKKPEREFAVARLRSRLEGPAKTLTRHASGRL